MSYADHDHRDDYADRRHDHDGDYAEKHHRHYDLEREAERLQGAIREWGIQLDELRRDLGNALARIVVLEAQHDGPVHLPYDPAWDASGDGTGADPDRPETWAFAEPAATEGAGRDTAMPGTRPLATLIAGAAAQECTYCHAGLGVLCVTGPDGWHLARFLGVLHGRAEARLVGAAATPHGDMGGIVWDVQPEVTS